jgi:hypothetical protein
MERTYTVGKDVGYFSSFRLVSAFEALEKARELVATGIKTVVIRDWHGEEYSVARFEMTFGK